MNTITGRVEDGEARGKSTFRPFLLAWTLARSLAHSLARTRAEEGSILAPSSLLDYEWDYYHLSELF